MFFTKFEHDMNHKNNVDFQIKNKAALIKKIILMCCLFKYLKT